MAISSHGSRKHKLVSLCINAWIMCMLIWTGELSFPSEVVESLWRSHFGPICFFHVVVCLMTSPIRPFKKLGCCIQNMAVVDNAWRKASHNVVDALSNVRKDSLEFNSDIFGNIF